MEYDYSFTRFYEYVHRVAHCQTHKYRIRHAIFQAACIIIFLRLFLSLILLAKYPEVWKIYKAMDATVYLGVELLFKEDIYTLLGASLLTGYAIIIDYFAIFCVKDFVYEDAFEDYHQAIQCVINKCSVKSLFFDKMLPPEMQSFRFRSLPFATPQQTQEYLKFYVILNAISSFIVIPLGKFSHTD